MDGALAGSAPIDPLAGSATWTASALWAGSRAITAAYAGDAEVRPSQSGAIQQVVDAATTQSGLEVEAIRNRRGRLVGVRLGDGRRGGGPGGGTPMGPVRSSRGGGTSAPPPWTTGRPR